MKKINPRIKGADIAVISYLVLIGFGILTTLFGVISWISDPAFGLAFVLPGLLEIIAGFVIRYICIQVKILI